MTVYVRAVIACLAAFWIVTEGVIALVAGRAPVFLQQELDWLQYVLLLVLVGLLTWAAVRRCLAGRRDKGAGN
ncbi:MAG: hypothetical protein NTW26_05535 [bacterium]|nr:hypothetical protein [bacterium]